MKNYGAMTNYLRLKVYHAYRINCWKKRQKNLHVDGVTIIGDITPNPTQTGVN